VAELQMALCIKESFKQALLYSHLTQQGYNGYACVPTNHRDSHLLGVHLLNLGDELLHVRKGEQRCGMSMVTA
jgi:hypothetical protein